MNKRIRRFAVVVSFLLSLGSRRAEAAHDGMAYQIPPEQYAALTNLYSLAGGNSWNQNSGWLNPTATEWYGVEVLGVQYTTNGDVSVTGYVASVVLQANNLAGIIHPSIGNLSGLQQ